MLNFAVHRNDPALKRLNALLVPHAVAPFYIKEVLMHWHAQNPDKLLPTIRSLNLYKNVDLHLGPLCRHDYTDLREGDFNDLQAATELDAEYGLLRRFASLNHKWAIQVLEPEEREQAHHLVNLMHEQVANHAWMRSDLPRFRALIKIEEQDHEPRPAWVEEKYLTARHANEHGLRH